jgi:TMEM175 potassium channel family protein
VRRRYARDSVEFNRVLAFSDGLFAIAMTLLVVSIGIPHLSDGDSVGDLPFPTALLGEYFENPLSVALYATNVGIVSGMEVLLFRHAYRSDLLERQPTPEIYRFGIVASLSPVLFFALSVPFAFLSTTLAVAIWFLTVPFGILAERRAPEGADQLLGG